MSKAIRLLVVEDSEDDAKLVIRMLRRGGFNAQHERVESAAAMAAALQRQPWDAVVSDYNMPGFSGLDALRILRSTGLDIPFILISGTAGEEIAVDAMKAGAGDFVMKMNLSRLVAVLERELKEAAMRAGHRQARRDLAESEQRYREMFSANPHPMWVFDLETLRFLSVNDAAVTHYGWSREELLAMTITDIRPAGEVQRVLSQVARLRHQEIVEAGVWKHRKKDGAILDVEISSHVIDFGGRAARVVLAHDVTDRLIAERGLRESEAGLHRAQAMARLANVITGPDGSFESWSESLPQLIGVEPAQMPKSTRGWLELIHPDDRALFRTTSIEAGRRGTRMSVEYRLQRGDGVRIHVRQVMEPIESQANAGGKKRWFNTLQDVTEHKRAEEGLRESEARFRSLTALSSDFYWETDVEHRLADTRHGPQHKPVVGGAQRGKTRWETPSTRPDAAGWEAHRAALDARQPFRDFEIARIDAEGVERHLSISGEPVFDESGAFKGYRGVGKDVTERKQAEDRIRRLNRIHSVLSGINAAIVRAGGSDELFRETCRIAVEHGGFGIAQVLLVDEGAYEIWPGPSAGIGTFPAERASFRPGAETIPKQGTTIRALRERKPAFTNDITAGPPVSAWRTEALRRGYGSVISLPLMVGERIVAVLLLNAKEKNFFNDEELRLLSELAGDVSFALDHLERAERLKIETAERTRAEARLARLNRVYAVLSGIDALIVRVRDRSELFREACRIPVEAGGFPMAWIGIIDREAKRLKPVAWHGTGPDYTDYLGMMRLGLDDAVPEGRGLAGRAVREREPVIANDIAHDPRITLKKEAAERGFRSLVILPLLVAEQAVGVMALYVGDVGFFDEEEMKLLQRLASDIAFALDHIDKANKLNYLAYYDQLTGLANRSLFHERLSQYLRSAQQVQGKLALILLDVVRFKTINDSLGRQAGDALLKQVAERLARAADPVNIARLGGDHFAVVLPEIKGRSEIGRSVERIWHDCFTPPFRVSDTELRISAKAGIALFPNDGADADTLFANAEAALKKARETGERHQFHARELTAGVAEELALENRLRQALENEQFVLHYQPKVELDTRRIVGVEALIRWQSPELGLVPPMKFIPLMEETGLILPVGAWALKQASLDHRKWVDLGLKAPRVAVNVSPIQLRQRDFVGAVEQAIVEGVAPTGIDLEITESLIMEDVQGSIEKLKAVRGLGVRIAIDDFGTGYSSLGYLAKLPVQSLKIDRSFIITMLDDPDTMTLVSTIISLAHSLRLKVVAEGVDAEGQEKMLRLLRCDEMQGYLFSRPVPFDQMTALLTEKATG